MHDVFDDLEALQAPDTDLLTTSRSSTVEARKPKKGEWFRVSGAHRPTPFLVYEEMRRDNAKTYIVTGEAARDRTIQGIARKRIVYVAINRFGEGSIRKSYAYCPSAASRQARGDGSAWMPAR